MCKINNYDNLIKKGQFKIGFIFQGDYIIFSNPCTVPIIMIEESIKQHKAKKNKSDVTLCGMIKLDFDKLK